MTTQRFPHSIAQKCDDGSTQQVYFDQPGMVLVDDTTGQTTPAPPLRETIGVRTGPWLVWTDFNGARCATSQFISQKEDFYPITCPPDGVPAI